ncbi:hypothetical protein G210_0610 [Candida maltosa Xu316]|uniref:Uncharacterized protein n=1 Tax=Candida maltosa (strain Xu316) TaxID=1245528 RepID=M3K222_CANMX|nr:hypothetical protein G210_0610 [Candida maltosa Xu316]
MTSYLKKDTKPVIHDIHTPQNYSNPLRLAFLGGSKSGKTSTISKLKLGNFPDTYYPTHQTNPILFNYNPSQEAQHILKGTIPKTKDIVLSKTLQSHEFTPVNPIYKISNNNQVSRILVEVIDTPSFNPHQVVPFLEASLHSDLGKEILRNLANEPRKPVSTNPLLVASGAGELNGNINGYFLVYSAIASYSPPGYEGVDETLDKDHSFNLLPIIKDALDEAWWFK